MFRSMSSVKAFVDGVISSNKVAVFSKTSCPYCNKARQALESQGIRPDALEWIEIDRRPDCSEIQDYLRQLTGGRSVPRVFIGQKFIGGGDETKSAAKSGKLVQWLKEVQAV